MQRGFTLLELSIVLVIIGLIIGGVTAGSSLIRNSQLQSVTTDIGKYQTAVQSFSYRYGALPGDMTNMSSYWSCSSCNGNGNGRIEFTAVGSAFEGLRFWQALGLAGMISGSYTGVCPAATCFVAMGVLPGDNVPRLRYEQAAISVFYMDPLTMTGDIGGSAGSGAKSYFLVGGAQGAGDDINHYPVFSPPDAQSLDAKIDDGKAQAGKVYAPDVGTCLNASNEYDLTSETPLCTMTFPLL